MRILQIITLSELGGAQSVVINLANRLARNHEVIVAAGGGNGKMWQMLSPDIKQEHCKHLKRSPSLVDDPLAIFDFKRLYRKYRPDIIHLHSSKAGILGRIAFPKSKVVYTVHGFDSIRIAYRKFLPLEKALQKRCRAIVGVSKYDERNLLNEGISKNVSVIYNGIKIAQKNVDNLFENIKQKKVLCVARLAAPKRWDIFLQTAALLPQYAFIWIGNQEEYQEEHPENVFFMGSLPNAGAYNEYADLFILPSNYEGLPIVILEAMSYGKPVVASNVGGISEIVENGKNGYVVENSPQAFAEKISYILENEDVYHSFSAYSLKRFTEDLTIDKMVDAYLDIYRKINK